MNQVESAKSILDATFDSLRRTIALVDFQEVFEEGVVALGLEHPFETGGDGNENRECLSDDSMIGWKLRQRHGESLEKLPHFLKGPN